MSARIIVLSFLLLLCSIPDLAGQHGVPASWERKRLALVIGIGNYGHLKRLANPLNDARLMARSLEALNFSVSRLDDPNSQDLRAALQQFGRELQHGDAVGLFYFAGHAVQIDGRNILLPADAKTAARGVLLDEVFLAMSRGGDAVNLVLLDACRDNPLSVRSKAVARGLAKPLAGAGTLIAYATAPGEVAADGSGAHSPFTEALARHMLTPGLTVEDALKEARREVMQATNDRQQPWDTSSLKVRFHFVPKRTIFPHSSDKLLEDGEVEPLDCAALWIARNEIFHRHGYCFHTARGRDYFGNEQCTTPDQNVIKTLPTEVPSRNVAKLSEWEERKCRKASPGR